jgi:CheY-like chemotaxis protein
LIEQGLPDYQVILVDDIAAIPALINDSLARAVVINFTHKKWAWQQLKVLRQELGQTNVPVVMCPLMGEREFGQALGVFDYLVKPVSREDLTDLLDRVNQLDRPVEQILVVDDDARMVNLLLRMLHSIGPQYNIARARNGREGLRKMRQQPPDLVLLDLSMPEMDGFTMLERIKADEELSDIPVALITAYTHPAEEERRLGGKMIFVSSESGFTNEEVLNYLQGILEHSKVPETLPRPGQLVKHSQ